MKKFKSVIVDRHLEKWLRRYLYEFLAKNGLENFLFIDCSELKLKIKAGDFLDKRQRNPVG